MPTIFAKLFWFFFVASIAMHFFIGGVVVGTQVIGEQHYFMLRQNKGEWMPVGFLTFWLKYIFETAAKIFIACCVIWLFKRWFTNGSIGRGQQ